MAKRPAPEFAALTGGLFVLTSYSTVAEVVRPDTSPTWVAIYSISAVTCAALLVAYFRSGRQR
jgi:hypothetical protein